MHPEAIRAVRPDVSVAFGDFDDVPLLVAKAVHEISESPNRWDDVTEKKREEKVRRAKHWLNTITVEAMTPALLDERDPEGTVRSWLQQIGEIMRIQ